MGPHFFKCGKQACVAAVGDDWIASMGPHFFKCGKMPKADQQRHRVYASMGPHFFKCGKIPQIAARFFAILGFNGAALFQVRKNGDDLTAKINAIELQWGRTFSSAEKEERKDNDYKDGRASMGPHFFKCGKNIPCNSLKDSWFYGGLRELFYFLD